MPRYFIDTSALVKRYRPEKGSDKVDELFDETGSIFFLSRLGIVETVSALALNVRAGQLSLSDYTTARKKFLGEIGNGKFRVVRLLVAHYRDAESLIDRHGKSHRCRTLDALQLSVATSLHRQGQIDNFLCADVVLCEVAAREHLPTLNPSGES